MTSDPAPTDFESSGGGHATASGMRFQAQVAAQFAAALLAQRPLDRRFGLGGAKPKMVRLETEAPIDDILVETDQGGFVFVQAKTSIALSENLKSPIGKTAQQFVRQWLASARGSGRPDWARPPDQSMDRFVLALRTGASVTASKHLALALDSLRAPGGAPLPDSQKEALKKFRGLIEKAYEDISGGAAADGTIDQLLRLVAVVSYDFEGADRESAVAMVRDCLAEPEQADAAFDTLTAECQRLMSIRLGSDDAGFRKALAAARLPVTAPPQYHKDIDALLQYSDRIRSVLEGYEQTTIGTRDIRVNRDCTHAVVKAAQRGSFVIVGEPGSGKSAVISAAASQLREITKNVLELAVDRLPVNSLEGLRGELGLSHAVVDVLRKWPGEDPGFLFIDALDATRGSGSEQVFRLLIDEVLRMSGDRWRVIASIRTFDLRMGDQFRSLFRGAPPDAEFSDASFRDVRHIKISEWSDQEYCRVLEQSPVLRDALECAGDRLKDLARVPFNTRLLADLLSAGVKPSDFGDAQSQVELLDLYWRHRVLKFGPSAELCLKDAVVEMVRTRSLRANRLAVAEKQPLALEHLLRESVIVAVSAEKFVSFRHHILFDYVASKVAFDLNDTVNSSELFDKKANLGLLLAPAVGFALQALWATDEEDRKEFWTAVVELVGDASIDPIVRSVVSRKASELPIKAGDFDGLVYAVASEKAKAKAAIAFGHIIGGLSVRLEDKQPINFEAWPRLASGVSAHLDGVAWSLRSLLFMTTERSDLEKFHNDLGVAARNLFKHGLEKDEASALVASAIGFVSDTYGSDPDASRELLRKVFSPDRFFEHAFAEVPWLARKVNVIARSDPSFVVEIFRESFSREITDDSTTTMGHSRILPLSSNRRQDYRHALWSLKESYADFLQQHPLEGIKALVAVVDGYQSLEHPQDERMVKEEFMLGEIKCVLVEDWSNIWASHPDNAQVEDALGIMQAFIQRLRAASVDEAKELAAQLAGQAEKALLWSRLFMVGSERASDLADVLWPYATQNAFLKSSDTQKDAIDFIAAAYPSRRLEERAKFEANASTLTFPKSSDPERARAEFLEKIFGTIGEANLATKEAQAFAKRAVTEGVQNDRPTRFWTTHGSSDDWWWLKDDSVDVKSASNARLLATVKDIRMSLKLEGGASSGTVEPGDFHYLATLDEAIAESKNNGTDEKVINYANGVLAEAVDKLASLNAHDLREDPDLTAKLIEYVMRFSTDPSPEVTPGLEQQFEKSASWGNPSARIEAAQAAMNLSRVDKGSFEALKATIEFLLVDSHPGVRHSIAIRLAALWETARNEMWELATQVAKQESNRGVASFFASYFLGRLVHHTPAEVEELTLILNERFGDPELQANDKILEQVGSIFALLWISHGTQASRSVLRRWLEAPEINQTALSHAVHTSRSALILGYESGESRHAEIRQRAQQFAAWAVEATAAKLETHFAKYKKASGVSDRERDDATASAKLLDNICDQFYFASGAFKHGNQDRLELSSIAQKRAYLDDIAAILHRIGDVATPHTVHHQIELLEFLMPADPCRVFDLTAHTLLGSGREQGYHLESLAVDRVVGMVGRFLADHRELFADEKRREQLVSCLELFMEAGWPAARRLIYRLPELLQ